VLQVPAVSQLSTVTQSADDSSSATRLIVSADAGSAAADTNVGSSRTS
jgi:hypothetical protein